jgi:hypothetical protein
MRKLSKAAFAFAALIALGAEAKSAEMEVWHGWANIWPCSKLITDNGFPYVKTSSQELHSVVFLNHDKLSELGDIAVQCTKDAGVAGLFAAIVSGGGAAFPAAAAAWSQCMSSRGKPVAASALRFTQYPKCNW